MDNNQIFSEQKMGCGGSCGCGGGCGCGGQMQEELEPEQAENKVTREDSDAGDK